MARMNSLKMTSVFSFIFCAWSGAVIAENTRLICILEGDGTWWDSGNRTQKYDLGKFKIQKDYVFSPNPEQILWTDETWLINDFYDFEETVYVSSAYNVTSKVTESDLYFQRKGIPDAPLNGNTYIQSYGWNEHISRYSGRIELDGHLYRKIIMSGKDSFYYYDIQASGKCEVTEKKF